MKKLNERAKLVDKKARLRTKKLQTTASAMKCYCGCNHHGERDKSTNDGTSSDECPRCREKETWEDAA